MANINFDTLVLKSDWAGALQTLLAESETAIKQQNRDQMAALRTQFITFIKRSPSMCDFLDDIALKAVDNLALADLNASLAAIQSRNKDLKAAIATIEVATEKAEKDAKALQLKNVIAALDKAKSAVETLKSLESKLEQPNQGLLARISSVTAAIEDLLKLAKTQPQA